MPGGFGVTLFFFLSGYLITTLFYAEYTSTLKISIPRFYLRRWLRLTPTLLIFVYSCRCVPRHKPHRCRRRPVPPQQQSRRYYIIATIMIYPGEWTPAKVIPFGICWSLAIEEHFYLAWPLILQQKHSISTEALAYRRFDLCGCTLMATAPLGIASASDRLHVYGHGLPDRLNSLRRAASILFEAPWASATVRLLPHSNLSATGAPRAPNDVSYSGRKFPADLPIYDPRRRADALCSQRFLPPTRRPWSGGRYRARQWC